MEMSCIFGLVIQSCIWASQEALVIKNSPANAEDIETQVRSLCGDDPFEKCMATHSSILAWRIPMDRGTWWATVHCVTQSRI